MELKSSSSSSSSKYVNERGSQISLPSFFPSFNDQVVTTRDHVTTTRDRVETHGTPLAVEFVRHSTKSMNGSISSQAEEMYETLTRQTTKLSTGLVERRSKSTSACHAQCRILEDKQAWNYVDVLHKCAGMHLKNSTDFHMFYVECMEFTPWMKADIMRCGQYLADVQTSKQMDERELSEFLENTKELSKVLSLWRVKLMELRSKGELLLPINLREEVLKESRAVRCISNYSDEQASVLEGEELLLLEKSSGKWKVRSQHGKEFHVPSTFLVILGPVPEALTEVVRLNETYGELWVVLRGLARKALVNLVCNLVEACDGFDEKSWMSMPREKAEKISSIVKLMEEAFGLSWCAQQPGMKERVEQLKAALNKTLQGGRVYPENKELLRQMLVKNPDLVTDLLKLFQESWSDKNRFWTPKVNTMCKAAEQIDEEQQLEAVHAIEEVYQLTRAKVTTETSHLTTSEQQENQTFVVTGVVNPKDKKCISLDDALKLGIINQQEGKYVGGVEEAKKIPIAEAMNQNLIRVEFTKKQILQEKRNDLGFITIKSFMETRPYTIRQVVDPVTKCQLSLDEAVKKGIIDQKLNVYRDAKSKTQMSFEEALDNNLLVVDFEEAKEAEQSKEAKVVAYAVYGVRDGKSGQWLSYKQAVEMGVLNPEDGTFVETSSKKEYKFVDAVDRGFIRAPIVPDHKTIDLQALI